MDVSDSKIGTTVGGNQICNECGTTFTRFSNLRKHVLMKHPGKLEELAPLRKKAQFKNTRKTTTLHKKNRPAEKRLQGCPLCHLMASPMDLRAHLTSQHSIRIESEAIEFASFEAFLSWKARVEKKTFASFVNMHGSKTGRKIIYGCHRSGFVRKRGNDIRVTKSSKMDAYCPAEMRAVFEGGGWIVNFCKTHIGHEQEEHTRHFALALNDEQNLKAVGDCTNLIQVSYIEDISQDLFVRQQRLIEVFQREIYNTESLQEIEAVEKIVATITPGLRAMRNEEILYEVIVAGSGL